jgi:hypothetical protein
MKVKSCAFVLLALIVSYAPVAGAQDVEPASTTWSRLVEGTKNFFRGSPNRSARPTAPASQDVPRERADASGSNGLTDAKAGKSTVKSAATKRKTRKPRRSVSEFMAQERP